MAGARDQEGRSGGLFRGSPETGVAVGARTTVFTYSPPFLETDAKQGQENTAHGSSGRGGWAGAKSCKVNPAKPFRGRGALASPLRASSVGSSGI